MRTKTMGVLFRIVALALLLKGEASAQDHSDAATQANNPLANMTAFNIQDYYIGDLTELDDSANQAWFRFAKPFSVSVGSREIMLTLEAAVCWNRDGSCTI